MPSDAENIAELQRQVRRQGELIDALYRQLGFGQLDAAGIPTAENDPLMIDAINSGNLIVAIKIYRERTGVGLKEAKDAVEAIARRMGR